MENIEMSEDYIRGVRHHTGSVIRKINKGNEKKLIRKEEHVEDVTKKIVELGLEISKKVVFNGKVLTIKDISTETGNIIFEESGIPKISVFSPSLEIYQE